MTLEKPTRVDDFLPSFEQIGAGDWEDQIDEMLESFDVPLPEAAEPEALAAVEKRLGTILPDELKAFYEAFGAVDFDGNRLLELEDFTSLADAPASRVLSRKDRKKAKEWIVIAENCAEDPIVLHVGTGNVSLCSHDPPGFEGRLSSFSDFIKLGLVSLPTGYYGWPDEELRELESAAQKQLFGQRINW